MFELGSGDATDHREDRFQVAWSQGFSRLGFRGGSRGVKRSAATLYHRLGISSSSSRIFVCRSQPSRNDEL